MKLGKYLLGPNDTPENGIYAGECSELMAALPNECIDLTVTSPPYDNLRDYHGYTFDFEAIVAQLWRVTKVGGVVVWVVGDATVKGSETGTSFRQALRFMELGFWLHDTMIYYKRNPPPSVARIQKRYEQCWEYMFVFSKDTPLVCNHIMVKKAYMDTRKTHAGHRKTNGEFTVGKVSRSEFRIKHNVWKFKIGGWLSATDKLAHQHSAIFPEALARDHIMSWSSLGDVVLDPMIGSGTTAKMAKQLGRLWLGFDISTEYVELARKRVRQTQPPLFVPEPRQDVMELV